MRKRGEGLAGDHLFAIHVPGCTAASLVLSCPPRHCGYFLFGSPPSQNSPMRNIHLALHLDIVAMDRHTDSRRFRRKFHAPFMHVVGKGAVEIIRQQVTDGAAVVPEEPLGFIHAPDQAGPSGRSAISSCHSRAALRTPQGNFAVHVWQLASQLSMLISTTVCPVSSPIRSRISLVTPLSR